MFDFNDLETALPPEAYVVLGAGSSEIDGIYTDTQVEAHGAPIFRHVVLSDQLLSREPHGDRHGWLIGASRRPLYGVRSDELVAPTESWRPFKGISPAPTVTGFSSIVDAGLRLSDEWIEEAEKLQRRGKFRLAAEVYKKALSIPALSDNRKAALHAGRAKSFRQLAEVKKKAELDKQAPKKKVQPALDDDILVGRDELESGDIDGLDDADSDAGANPEPEDETLVSLAAELAIEDAELALQYNSKNYLAAWEGAIAAKHIGWWEKGRRLAKKALDAVPRGPSDRARREEAQTLFLLCAETEQEEKRRLITTMAKKAEPEPLDQEEVAWVKKTLDDFIEALRMDDFKRPHHQLWKMVSPGLNEKDHNMIMEEIRRLVWDKWRPLAWNRGYRKTHDERGRSEILDRISKIYDTNREPDVYDKVQLIQDLTCMEWEEIPASKARQHHDETWAYGRKQDGSWGSPNAGISFN